MNWSSLSQGVNLQGNPIQCTCASQWMIDFLMPQLHANREFHQYLLELRCSAPESFKSHRLVRYLGHESSFCGSQVGLLNCIPSTKYEKTNLKCSTNYSIYLQKIDYFKLINANRLDADDDNSDDTPFSGMRFWIIVGLLATIGILSVAIGVALIRRRREWQEIRKNNRRYESNGFFVD